MTPHLVGSDPSGVRDRVSAVIGPEGVFLEEGTTIAAPASNAETAELLRVASEEGWRVLPRGAGLGPDLSYSGAVRSDTADGAIPLPDLIVSSTEMTGLIDHEPADLNVCVRAGMRLKALQSSIAGERQWLALDPPGGGDISLGGVVSTGLSGPLRAQYGRPRDHLLGLTLVDGRGRVLRLGGRVVKNVAGFDLVRLAAGSQGALGMITEITFRLHPRPEEDRTLIWQREDLTSGWKLGRNLAGLPIPLAAAELLAGVWPSPLESEGVQVLLRLTGSERAVQGMVHLATETAGEADRELTGGPSVAASQAISEGDVAGPIAFRLHSLPANGGILLSSLSQIPLERLALHLLGGTCRGTMSGGGGAAELTSLAESARSLGGTLSVTRGRGAEIGVEGSTPIPSSKARLRSEILRGFDPYGTLPGAWRDGWLESTAIRA